MVAKFGVMYAISRATGAGNETAQRVAVALAQGGEFAFVLFATAATLGALDAATSELMVMVVTISLLLAPLLFVAHERVLERWLEKRSEPEYDVIDAPATPVIIAGYGRYGQIVSRVLRMCDIPFTALEVNYQQVDFVRRFGSKIYFGDASRLDLLQAAKTGEARLFVLAIDDVDASVRTATLVRRHFPDLPILARARNRVHHFRLRDLGIQSIYRETFPSSLDVAHQALLRLGVGITAAQRAVTLFKQHDEAQLELQHAVRHDEARLIQTAQEAAAQLKDLFEADSATLPHAKATATP
jgi:glutathione-regulated potassium-efflux system ancillary protein KefC/glutathione-regulated potassium-efflux system protein KefB